jgi:hypothetical protein cdiviTM7_01629
MKKTDNYGARVKIENIVESDLSEVDKNSLFALLTGLTIKKGRIFYMDIILASRGYKYSGHSMLAEKRLSSRSTSVESPPQFPRGKTELRSWRDKHGVHSVGGGKRRIQKEYLFFFR